MGRTLSLFAAFLIAAASVAGAQPFATPKAFEVKLGASGFPTAPKGLPSVPGGLPGQFQIPEVLKPLPDKKAKPKDLLFDGGVINNGGGGVFSASFFWEFTLGVVKPRLKALRESQTDGQAWFMGATLTNDEADRVIALMDPNVVKILISKNPIYVKENGQDVQKDAVNVPGANEIYLYSPNWEYYFTKGVAVSHLILHEFLGLARIDDTGYKNSRGIFPDLTEKLSFKAKEIACNDTNWSFAWDGNAYLESTRDLWEYPQTEPTTAPFSAVKEVAPRRCSDEEQAAGCVPETFARRLRTASLRYAIAMPGESKAWPRYWIELKAVLEGYGSQKSQEIRNMTGDNAFVSLLTQLMVQESEKGEPRVLATANEAFGAANGIQLILTNNDFFSALTRKGLSLDTDLRFVSAGNHAVLSGLGMLSPESVSAVLDRAAAGAQNRPLVLKQKIFDRLPEAFPAIVRLQCRLNLPAQ